LWFHLTHGAVRHAKETLSEIVCLAAGVISGARMLDNPETIWLGVAALGIVCVIVIYVAARSP
jgi:hypothetical protein